MVDSRPMPFPFATGTPVYAENGWDGIIPVRTDTKQPAETGITGRSGIQVTAEQSLNASKKAQYGNNNIALRLPRGIVGIDVDQYGDKQGGVTLGTLESELGKLPPTFFSTARGVGVSGIRYYRVPDDLEFEGVFGPDIECIQFHHRFALVWPSIHPDTGEQYTWYSSEGEQLEHPPTPDSFPELPQAWIERFGHEPRTHVSNDDFGGVEEFLNRHDSGDREDLFKNPRSLFENETGSRHDSMLKALGYAMRDAAAGLYPARLAEEKLREMYEDAVGDDRPNDFDDLLARACSDAEVEGHDPERINNLLNIQDQEAELYNWMDEGPVLLVVGLDQAQVLSQYTNHFVVGLPENKVEEEHLDFVENRDAYVLLSGDPSKDPDVHEAGLLMKSVLKDVSNNVKFFDLPYYESPKVWLNKTKESSRRSRLEARLNDLKDKPSPKQPTGKPSKSSEVKNNPVPEPDEDDDRDVLIDNEDPMIVVNNLIYSLKKKWDGRKLFNYGGTITRVREDETIPLKKDEFQNTVIHCVRVMAKSTKSEETVYYSTKPSSFTISTAFARAEDFTELDEIKRAPFVRPDGTVCQDPGYDSASKTLLFLDDSLSRVSVPDRPTEEQVRQASDLILNDWLVDFVNIMPTDKADRANLLALMITPFIRGSVPTVPLAVINGLQASVGKNLLADVFHILATGKPAETLPFVRDEAELRKQVTSAFREGTEHFIFDEAHVIDGTVLAQALTAPIWSDRILGGSNQAKFPNRATWLALANQVRVEDDMLRRVYEIALRPNVPNPQDRAIDSFHHPELKEWTVNNRARLLEAILTIIRSWYANGCPAPSKSPSFASFERWEKLTRGILENAGIDGFLDNQKQFRNESTTELNFWEDHLTWVRNIYGNNEFTASDIVTTMRTDMGSVEHPPGMEDTSPKDYSRRLGIAYGKIKDRFIGNYRIIRLERRYNNKVLWKVISLGEEGFDDGSSFNDDSGNDTDPDPFDDVDDDFEDEPVSEDPFTSPDEDVTQQLQDYNELVFDIETCDASELWTRDDFVRLSGYNGIVTDEHSNLVSAIEQSETVIGHNIVNFDLIALARYHGLDFESAAEKAFDTLITVRQVEPPSAMGMPAGFYSLDQVAKRWGVEGKTDDLKKLAKKHGGYDKIPTDDAEYHEYLHGDLESSRAVYNELKPYYDNDPYIQREHKVAARMARPSLEGFRVDTGLLNQRLEEQRERKSHNYQRLNEVYGVPLTTDKGKKIKSPLATKKGKEAFVSSLNEAGVELFRKTEKTQSISTNKEDLQALIDFYTDDERLREKEIDPTSIDKDTVQDLCQLVIDVTSERTVYQTVNNHLVGDRVHPTISPDQASGRWSVTKPGLTVLGKRGGKWRERELFLPEEGHVIVAVDLDQVDARAVAANAQDPEYNKLFEPGKDLHAEVAQTVFGSSDKEWRERAKILNHGFSYGLGINGMVRQTGVSEKVASTFYYNMKRQFPVLAQWQDNVREIASTGELLDNGWGRKMRADPDRSFTQGPALVGQGGTRDIIAEGILRLPSYIVPMMRVVIHDEIVFSIPQRSTGVVVPEILEAMSFDFKGIPITGGASKPGENWGQVYG